MTVTMEQVLNDVPECKKDVLVRRLIDVLGLVDDVKEALFILPDGRMIGGGRSHGHADAAMIGANAICFADEIGLSDEFWNDEEQLQHEFDDAESVENYVRNRIYDMSNGLTIDEDVSNEGAEKWFMRETGAMRHATAIGWRNFGRELSFEVSSMMAITDEQKKQIIRAIKRYNTDGILLYIQPHNSYFDDEFPRSYETVNEVVEPGKKMSLMRLNRVIEATMEEQDPCSCVDGYEPCC